MVKHNDQSRMIQKNRKRKKRRRRLFILLPLLLILVAGMYGAYLYVKAGNSMDASYVNDGRDKSDLRDEMVDPKYDNVTILLMGVDSNEKRRENDDNQLTDTLMLATLNKDDNSVKLLSIPRDSYVYIPEIGKRDKINHAHAFGGPEATIGAVENLLDIPVDYWVKVNFDAFTEVVNAINGINVEVPYEFKESNSNDKRDAIHLLPGEQTLNGEEALALARTRKHDNDLKRAERQQDIIKAVMNKATSISSILKVDNMIDAVGDNMKTNMSFKEMKSFIGYGVQDDGVDMDSYTLEGYDYQPAGTYYYQLDEGALAETKHRLRAHLDMEPINPTKQPTETYEASEEDAAGSQSPY